MSNPEETQSPEETPTAPRNYESWNEGFVAGAQAGKQLSDKIWKSKLVFRTFAASIGGTWFCGMAMMALGPSMLALFAGAAGATFFFYVLDQTEQLFIEGAGKLRAYLKERKLKKEKKDGDSDSGSTS